MDASTYARQQLKSAFELFHACAGGMTDEQYNWKPGGTCNVAAKSHVHALSSIDFFVNAVVRAGKPRWGEVAAAHSLPENPLGIWAYDGPIPYEPVDVYGKKLQAEVLDYVESLSDADLDREIDTQFFGRKSVAWLLQLGVNHLVGHGGDIAAVKGMQGLKGLPF
jgi:hypothetical protein